MCAMRINAAMLVIAGLYVAAASLTTIAQVRVTFTALGAYPNADRGSSRFQSDIALRTDDPSDEDNTPEC